MKKIQIASGIFIEIMIKYKTFLNLIFHQASLRILTFRNRASYI